MSYNNKKDGHEIYRILFDDKEEENKRYNDKFDLSKYMVKEEEPEDELLDYTFEFLELLKKLSGEDGFGAIIWIIGTTGSGKSTLMCELDDILLKSSYPKRNVAFYKAPKKLLKEVKKAVPSTLRNKFRNIDKLTEVKKFDILNIDEGCLTADAKNALLKDSVNFIASLTTLRHNSVIIILNSLDNGILRGYRTKAQIRLYKLLPEGYLNETNDKFAKKHRETITNLRQEQTVFSISHIDFLKKDIKKGALILPMKKYCSWYNQKISRSFEGEDFDARMRRLVKKKLDMEDVIMLLIHEFGRELTVKLARGFLFDKYLETFRDFEQDIKSIVEVAKYRMYDSQRTTEEEERIEAIEQINYNTEYYNISLEFADYVKDNISIDVYSKVGYGLCSGLTRNEIINKYPELTKYEYDKTKDFLTTKADMDTRLSGLFENWFALRILKVPKDQLSKAVSHGRLLPDNMWKDNIYSLKFSVNNKKLKESFFVLTDMRPEFDMAVKNKTVFKLVYFNPYWMNKYGIGFLISKDINPEEEITQISVRPTGFIYQNNININTSI